MNTVVSVGPHKIIEKDKYWNLFRLRSLPASFDSFRSSSSLVLSFLLFLIFGSVWPLGICRWLPRHWW